MQWGGILRSCGRVAPSLFWQGLTGLTVTVLAIVTLAIVMLLTGRLRWSEVLARRAAPRPALGSAS